MVSSFSATTHKQPLAVVVLAVFTILFGTVLEIAAAQKPGRLTEKQAKALIAKAETHEDHMKLAAYFNQEADRLDADAKDHEELAQTYKSSAPAFFGSGKSGNANPQSRTFQHCDAIAKSLRDAAKSARDLAAEHEQMAKEASK